MSDTFVAVLCRETFSNTSKLFQESEGSAEELPSLWQRMGQEFHDKIREKREKERTLENERLRAAESRRAEDQAFDETDPSLLQRLERRRSRTDMAIAAARAARSHAEAQEARAVVEQEQEALRLSDARKWFRQQQERYRKQLGLPPSPPPDSVGRKVSDYLASAHDALNKGQKTLGRVLMSPKSILKDPWAKVETLLAILSSSYLSFYPSFPAANMLSLAVFWPHLHYRGVPVQWPSVGIQLIGTPSVLINLLPAGSLDAMGLTFGCGGFAPYWKPLCGSSTVFIQGKRATRIFDLAVSCRGTQSPAAEQRTGSNPERNEEDKGKQSAGQEAKAAGKAPEETKKAPDEKKITSPLERAQEARSRAFGRVRTAISRRRIKSVFRRGAQALGAHSRAELEKFRGSLFPLDLRDTLLGKKGEAGSETSSPWKRYLQKLDTDLAKDARLAEQTGTRPPGKFTRWHRKAKDGAKMLESYAKAHERIMQLGSLLIYPVLGWLTEPDEDDHSPEAEARRAKAESYYAQAGAVALALAVALVSNLLAAIARFLDGRIDSKTSAVGLSPGIVIVPMNLSVLIGGFPLPDTKAMIEKLASWAGAILTAAGKAVSELLPAALSGKLSNLSLPKLRPEELEFAYTLINWSLSLTSYTVKEVYDVVLPI